MCGATLQVTEVRNRTHPDPRIAAKLPLAVTTAAEPWGLPDLTPQHLHQLLNGSLLLGLTLEIADAFVQSGGCSLTE